MTTRSAEGVAGKITDHWHASELDFVRAFEKVWFGNLKTRSGILPGNPNVLQVEM